MKKVLSIPFSMISAGNIEKPENGGRENGPFLLPARVCGSFSSGFAGPAAETGVDTKSGRLFTDAKNMYILLNPCKNCVKFWLDFALNLYI